MPSDLNMELKVRRLTSQPVVSPKLSKPTTPTSSKPPSSSKPKGPTSSSHPPLPTTYGNPEPGPTVIQDSLPTARMLHQLLALHSSTTENIPPMLIRLWANLQPMLSTLTTTLTLHRQVLMLLQRLSLLL